MSAGRPRWRGSLRGQAEPTRLRWTRAPRGSPRPRPPAEPGRPGAPRTVNGCGARQRAHSSPTGQPAQPRTRAASSARVRSWPSAASQPAVGPSVSAEQAPRSPSAPRHRRRPATAGHGARPKRHASMSTVSSAGPRPSRSTAATSPGVVTSAAWSEPERSGAAWRAGTTRCAMVSQGAAPSSAPAEPRVRQATRWIDALAAAIRRPASSMAGAATASGEVSTSATVSGDQRGSSARTVSSAPSGASTARVPGCVRIPDSACCTQLRASPSDRSSSARAP